MSTVITFSSERNPTKSGRLQGTNTTSMATALVIAIVVVMVTIVLVLVLVYLRRNRLIVDRTGKRCAKSIRVLISLSLNTKSIKYFFCVRQKPGTHKYSWAPVLT